MFTSDSAYLAGRKAYRDGEPTSANPHNVLHSEWERWRKGYFSFAQDAEKGYQRGSRDMGSRMRNRPGDGDMGG